MLLDQKQQERKEQMVLSIQQNQRNNQYGPVVEITLEMGVGKMIAVKVPGSGPCELRGGDRDV